MAETRAILYGFWASSCTWRVRAALHFKGIAFEEKSVDIVTEQKQLTDEYRYINPSQKVPALVMNGETIVESMAIIQYMEEIKPEASLVPTTPILRARMREICETIVSGIQPLQNIGLKRRFDSEHKFKEFAEYFTSRGLESVEELLKKTTGRFCIGDQITVADLCLVPQVYNGIVRYKMNMEKFPIVSSVYEHLLKEKTFIETHPKNIK
ncbi:probable maleylacetoacetate isomerase 1 [Danaus plexippus]|uniref:probable maleylacetoacetate isomerase 1 n=1 Tax=Danaus plexippus TaxID=13037 RepID=UPI002AB2FE7A|nr:probable maleylacetoacetate isomerase 1 [Danaus plexippus]